MNDINRFCEFRIKRDLKYWHILNSFVPTM